ncbi:MAG: TldD/PmbA family protein [Oscillospiraceae bacterium]|nr:TldD/PmbA family protein [Oscillospiraceae bacterium]
MNDSIKKLILNIPSHTEVRTQTITTRRVGVLGGKLINNISARSSGAGARVYKNGVWGFSSIGNTDEDSVREILRSAEENASLLDSRKPKNKGALINAGATEFSEKRKFQNTDQKQLIDFARAIDSYIEKKYPSLVSRSVGITANCIEKELITSEGTFSYQLFPRVYIIVSMSDEAKDGENIELFDILGGGEGYFTDYYSDPSALYPDIDKLYTELQAKKEGIFPDAGEKLCIIDSAISGMVAHEAVGHTVEADLVLSGSVAAVSLGKQVASPLVNITDFAFEAFGKKAPLPVYVDDEGTLCRDAVIIKDGILTGYMNNLESALHFGVQPCGNARAYAFSDEPLIRMRNTAIHPGKDKLEDMIASVDNGYYLTKTQNGQADMTGEFMFGITMGYEIKNGKLGRALRDTTISGVAFNMLKTVDMLSDNVTWDFAGYCGKKQPMPVGMGGPALRCRVNIGGR